MLVTPFGSIRLLVDKVDVLFEVKPVEKNDKVYPDVDGAYLVRVKYKQDGNRHSLRCILDNTDVAGWGESGERLEMTSIYQGTGKLSIGTEADFCEPKTFDYDYGGRNLPNGLEIEINPQTKTQYFIFGIAWLNECSEEKDVQTWYAADPTITGRSVNWIKDIGIEE